MPEKFENFNKPEANQETEQNPEIQAEFTNLENKVNEVGNELENTDFTKIEPTEALKLQGKIEIVCNALSVAAGATAAYYSGEAMFDKIQPLNDTWRAVAAGVGFTGTISAMYGLQKLVDGYRKILGYVKKDEAKFYKDLG